MADASPSFTFDGKRIPIAPGDTYGSALHRAGVLVLSRSLKYHRPRGLYCCSGSCASCFVDVDGIPNVPACTTKAVDQATLTSQNRLGSAKHDLYGLVDKVYRKGFDPHAAFTKPRLLNAIFLKGVRHMSGLGKAPKAGKGKPATAPAPVEHPAPDALPAVDEQMAPPAQGANLAQSAQPASAPSPSAVATGPSAPGPGQLGSAQQTARRLTMEFDELIIGAGLRGLQRAQAVSQAPLRAAAQTKARTRRRVLVVDELDAPGGSARWDASETETRRLAEAAAGGQWPGVEVWTSALCFGLYTHDGPGHVAAIRRGTGENADLIEIRAARITVATGRHDAWPLFVNNDLPGILSVRGARRLLGEHGVLPGKRIVVHGASLGEDFAADLEAHGGRIVATGNVTVAKGTTHVTKARVDDAWHGCDVILCNIPGTPRIELLQQAGCELSVDDEGMLVARSHDAGATSRAHIFTAFSGAPLVAEGPTPRTKRGAAGAESAGGKGGAGSGGGAGDRTGAGGGTGGGGEPTEGMGNVGKRLGAPGSKDGAGRLGGGASGGGAGRGGSGGNA